MEWSKEQIIAINEDGKNILVSAGAGSGKTAVLTERIIRKIKEGVPLSKLLVLTFTRAAALEMKERVKKAISNDDALKSHLGEVASANITTFDAYALSFVKRYHYVLKINQDIELGDETFFKVKRTQILDQIFEREYHNLDANFVRLVKDYNIKSDDDLKDKLLKINDKLDLRVDKKEYLAHLIEVKYIQNDIQKLIDEYFDLIKDNILDMNDILYGEYSDAYDKSKYHYYFDALIHATTYQEVYEFASMNQKLPRLVPNSGATKVNDALKDIYKKITEMVSFGDEKELRASFTNIDVYLEPMVRILIELDRQITAYKKSINLYQFIDIAKMGINILEDNPPIRKEMREGINEILIDEYQDTSNLQEQFINLFANNNVYMVGDIKQSIYRFRNANPELFANKYRHFSNNDGGIKVDLNNNFRSRDEVVSDINYCFNLIMDDDFGGAKYQLEHQMKAANKGYFEEGKIDQDYHLQVINYEIDKENKEYSRFEQEAFIIANDIKNKIDSGYLIFDVKKKESHPARASDFAILIARTTHFELYKRIFDYLKIPLNPLKDDTINNSVAIKIIRNILKLILYVRNDNYSDDFNYCFMSVGRSFLFEYSDDELFHFIKQGTYKESSLYMQIVELSKEIANESIDDLLSHILDSFDVYHNLVKIGDIHDATVRIEYLLELAKTNSAIGNNLEDFVAYVDEVFDRDFEIKFSGTLLEGDAVRLMSIHKSKGLEFNVVYYPDFANKFNIEDIKAPFNYTDKYGITAPYQGKTPFDYLIKANFNHENISERIRLLYVALTRAKEKMIIVSNFDEDKHSQGGFDGVSVITKKHFNSFNDIFESIYGLLMNKSYIINLSYADIPMTKNYLVDSSVDIVQKTSGKIIKVINLDLPYLIKEKAKISKQIGKLIDPKTSKLLEFGEKMHYILEIIDLKKPNLEGLNLNDFEQKKIEGFLNQSIFMQSDIINVYHEYEFVYNKDNIFFHGIIDLIVEREYSIDIIDYKLKNIDDENYLSQLLNYKKYLATVTNKPISIYLYSLIDERMKLVQGG